MSSSLGQERLTDFGGSGAGVQNRIVSFKNTNYLIQTGRDDLIEVYKLLDGNTKVFLHSKEIRNSFEIPSRIVIGKHIIINLGNAVGQYDFFENKLTEIMMIPEKFDRASFNTLNGHTLLITFIDTGVESKIYTYDFKSAPKELPAIGFHYIGSDYCVSFNYVDSLNETMIINYNVNSSVIDTTTINCSIRNNWVRRKDELYFMTCVDYLTSYNLKTHEIAVFEKIIIPHNRTPKLYVDESIVLLADSENDYVVIYDKLTQNRINQYYGDYLYPESFNIYGNADSFVRRGSKMLIYGETYLTIIDINGNRYSTHRKRGSWNGYTIDTGENEILNCRSSNGKNIFELINLDSRKDYLINYDGIVQTNYNVTGVIEYDSITLISLYASAENAELLTFDFQNLNCFRNLALDASQTGFSYNSFSFTFNDEIYVYDGNIHHYDGTHLTKINPGRIRTKNNVPFKRIDGKLYFVLDTSLIICSYDGHDLVKEFDLTDYPDINISGYYGDYSVLGDFVFVKDRYTPGQLFIVNKSNHSYETKTGIRGLNYYYDLVNIGAYVYFEDQNGLNRSDGIEFWNIRPKQGNNTYLFKIGNHVLESSSGGLWEIHSDGSYSQLIDCENCFTTGSGVIVHEDQLQALIFIDSSYYHYDGSASFIEKVPVRWNPDFTYVRSNLCFIEEDHVDGTRLYRVYDFNTQKLFDVKPHHPNEQIRGHVITGSGEFFIGLSVSAAQIYLYIYTARNGRDKLELLETYLMPNYFRSAFNGIENVALSSTGNHIFKYTGDDSVSKLENIIGCQSSNNLSHPIFPNVPEPEATERALYFLACEPISGRQLYKYSIESTSSNNGTDTASEIILFPNPADNHLSLLNLDNGFEKFQYTIYSIDGRIIQSGKDSRFISIYNLVSGLYILEMQLEGKTVTETFLKI